MSHFSKVATKITDVAALERALGKIGHRIRKGSRVRGYAGQTLDADICVEVGTSKYDIGIVRGEDGGYSLVADWWGIETTTGRTENEVVGEILRGYAVERVVAACTAEGYEVDLEGIVHEANGEVKITATAWN